jgi:protein O-mannosyl-transferase
MADISIVDHPTAPVVARRSPIFWLLVIAAFVLLLIAYSPALRAGYIWDDDLWVIQNPTLRSAHGLWQIWTDIRLPTEYYPLTVSAFWLQYQLWGLNPLGYHLVNVLLHAINAVLVGMLLSRLKVPGAWVAAALFAFHPVQVESVAWVTELKNTLSGLFYLVSAIMFFKANPLEIDAPPPPHWKRIYILSLFLFLCAMLAKTVTLTLPGALLVVIWWKRGRIQRRDWLLTIPFILLGGMLGAFATWMQTNPTHTGASGPMFAFTIIDRCLIAGHAIWFYLGKLEWPSNLMFIYPRWQIDPHQSWQVALPIFAVVMVIILWVQRPLFGRAPLAAMLIFAGTLFPALGFFNVYWQKYSFVADHMQYLACIAPLALFAAIGAQWIEDGSLPLRLGAGFVVAVVVFIYAALVWQQSGEYTDSLTLWEATARKNPGSWMVRTNLARALDAHGFEMQAAEQMQAALQLGPDAPDAHWNIGVLNMRQGNVNAAIAQFRQSIELDPHYISGYLNLARALQTQRYDDQAVEILKQGIAANPNDATLWIALAEADRSAGRIDQAMTDYQKAIELNPDIADAHFQMGDSP